MAQCGTVRYSPYTFRHDCPYTVRHDCPYTVGYCLWYTVGYCLWYTVGLWSLLSARTLSDTVVNPYTVGHCCLWYSLAVQASLAQQYRQYTTGVQPFVHHGRQCTGRTFLLEMTDIDAYRPGHLPVVE